jgi:hypothetical protein
MHTHVWEYGYAEFASVALRWLFPHWPLSSSAKADEPLSRRPEFCCLSFRDAPAAWLERTRNLDPWVKHLVPNLEIPGSMLGIAPE